MANLERDARTLMGDYVTLRFLLTFSGLGLTVAGSLLTFLWTEISGNADAIAELNKQTAALVETVAKVGETQTELVARLEAVNAFHTDQRVRLWDRVNENETTTAGVGLRVARIEGQLDGIARDIGRLLERLDRPARD